MAKRQKQDDPGIGHNSEAQSVAADELKAFVERVERLEDEKAGIAGDIKEVYAEAKAHGFDTKIMRKIVALRRRDADEVKEENAILEMYCQALGLDFML